MVELTRMTTAHLDEVFEIEKDSFATPWTRETLEKELTENEMAVYVVALSGGEVVGYAGMWHIVNEGHITNIAVRSDFRRGGVGGMVLGELIRVAKEREMMGITLEVRISNTKAQRLYTKNGFRPEGFRRSYYNDTGEDAVIMWKYFPEQEHSEKGVV